MIDWIIILFSIIVFSFLIYFSFKLFRKKKKNVSFIEEESINLIIPKNKSSLKNLDEVIKAAEEIEKGPLLSENNLLNKKIEKKLQNKITRKIKEETKNDLNEIKITKKNQHQTSSENLLDMNYKELDNFLKKYPFLDSKVILFRLKEQLKLAKTKEERIDFIKEEIIKALKDKYDEIKIKISQLRKKGIDTFMISTSLMLIPPKITMLKATFTNKDMGKLKELFDNLDSQINTFNPEKNGVMEKKEKRSIKGRKPSKGIKRTKNNQRKK